MISLSLGVFIVILAFFGLRGYMKGFFGALSRTLSLLAAYIAAFFLVKPAADLLQTHTELEGMVVYLVAGLIIFIGVSVLMTLIFNGLDSLTKKNEELTGLSRLGGLLVGTTLGGLLGLLVVYGMGMVREIREPAAVAQMTVFEASARKWVSKSFARLAAFAHPEAAPFTESLFEAPLTMGKSLQKIANNADIKMLVTDVQYQHLLNAGESQALAQDPLFKRILKDPDIQYLLQQSALIPEGAATDETVARALIDGWQGVQSVRQDARVQEIMNDPEFKKKLQSGDQLAFMTDPQFQELTEAFFQAVAETRASAAATAPSE